MVLINDMIWYYASHNATCSCILQTNNEYSYHTQVRTWPAFSSQLHTCHVSCHVPPTVAAVSC